MLKILKLNLFSLFLALLFLGTANASTITEQASLSFGSFTVGSAGGTITFNAGEAISADGDIILMGGHIAGIARLDTSDARPGQIFVTVIGATLISGVNSMDVVGNCLGVGGVLGEGNGDCSFFSNQNNTSYDVTIGGELIVGASQPAGGYTGVLEVTTNF